VASTRRHIDDRERRRRLAVRHHLASPAPTVGTSARSLIALHATDPASVYLSAWSRVGGLTQADVDDALYDSRTMVKHMAMRRTVWAVATDLLPVVQAAASDIVAAAERRRLARDLERCGIAEDGAAWILKAERAALRTLETKGPSFGRELSAEVPMLRTKLTLGSGAKAQEIGVVTRIMTILSASGQVTRARAGGGWHQRQPRWARMVDWVPEAVASPPPTAASARAELARCWLQAFGPATVDDVKWWTGWTVAVTIAALADIGAVEVGLDGGGTGVVLADDLEDTPDPEPWVALLPSLDPTTMAWKQRDWYLGAHRDRLFDPYGNAGPTIWADGRVVGGWGQRPDGEVVLHFLDEVGAAVTQAATARAEALTRWLDGVQVRPSFPTPLQRQLAAPS
jgi:hypothetical protein